MDGWIVLNKPWGMHSTRAVAHVKRLLKASKAGHAGTLDPLATGVLPIALGAATRLMPFLQVTEKIYRFTVVWGIETETLDAEGAGIAWHAHRPQGQEIRQILNRFCGQAPQQVPRYAAVKLKGQRAYTLARQGKKPAMPTRYVRIDTLKCCCWDAHGATFEVTCGPGTYVRSLARDIAYVLGTVGCVGALHRQQAGPFHEAQSLSFQQLAQCVHQDKDSWMHPLQTGLTDMSKLILAPCDCKLFCQGQSIPLHDLLSAAMVQCYNFDGVLLGLGRIKDRAVHPCRVLQYSTKKGDW